MLNKCAGIFSMRVNHTQSRENKTNFTRSPPTKIFFVQYFDGPFAFWHRKMKNIVKKNITRADTLENKTPLSKQISTNNQTGPVKNIFKK